MTTSSRTFLYSAVCIANLAALTCGIAFGWTSPIIPKLSNNHTNPLPEPITTAQSSWIGSLLPIGAVLGPFAAGIAADQIGRKNALLASTSLFVIAFICAAFAKNLLLFYAVRFICGFGTGGIFTVLPMYIGEISEDSVRGSLGSMLQLFVTFGILFSYSLGPYVDVMTFNVSCAIVPVLFLILFFAFVPESPYYLMAINNEEEAENSLMKLRMKSRSDVAKEIEEIKKNVGESREGKASIECVFKSRGLRKAVVLSVGLVAFQQLSGINVIIFYTETIFKATGSTIPADISTIIIGLIQIVFSSATPMLVEKKGKRFLLLLSASGMTIFQFTLGYYFLRAEMGRDVHELFWLPILSLVVYIATYCVGFGSLPWAVMGELFPQNIKCAASTLTSSGCWILAFVITKYFSIMAEHIGNGFSFFIFGGFCLMATLFVFTLLPETTGKSLQEIQDILEGREQTKC